jgi:hypothetical protein
MARTVPARLGRKRGARFDMIGSDFVQGQFYMRRAVPEGHKGVPLSISEAGARRQKGAGIEPAP